MMTLAELHKRDKGRCHICELPVRMADATRDHLVPKALGGTNHRDNIALAHSWCNREKGNRVFRAEQHGTGWVIVDPKNEIVSEEYPELDAKSVAEALNRDRVYLDPHYEEIKIASEDGVIVVSRNSVSGS